MEVPDVWLQAQASVQAQLDQEVFAEAADLAEAQWSDMTLVARLTQARGSQVNLVVSGIPCIGILTEVSASGEFILLQCAEGESAGQVLQLIRTECINVARSLPRGVTPVAEALARNRIGFREGSWLRGQWGSRVRIRIQGRVDADPVRGLVAAVGRDFIEIEIDNGEGVKRRLIIALGSVISMTVAKEST